MLLRYVTMRLLQHEKMLWMLCRINNEPIGIVVPYSFQVRYLHIRRYNGADAMLSTPSIYSINSK
jgi:hypothetical protein